MREGMVGGQFWSVYVDCDYKNQKHFDDPTVRFTFFSQSWNHYTDICNPVARKGYS